jgi:hypothetical protein
MRKVGAWSLTAALIFGLSTASARADDDTQSSTPKPNPRAPTWDWKPSDILYGSRSNRDDLKPIAPKPAPKPDATIAKKPATPVKQTSTVADAAAERSRQEAALLRRLQVCDKLKEIAIRTNDAELLRRAEQLEERSQACYTQRTARLRGLAGGFQSDEKTVDQYLGTGKSRASVDAPHTVSSDDHSSRAAMKEGQP